MCAKHGYQAIDRFGVFADSEHAWEMKVKKIEWTISWK